MADTTQRQRLILDCYESLVLDAGADATDTLAQGAIALGGRLGKSPVEVRSEIDQRRARKR